MNRQPLNSSSPLAGATGLGSVGAAIFGLPGAIIGIAAGFMVGYWAEVETQKNNHVRRQEKGRKAHA